MEAFMVCFKWHVAKVLFIQRQERLRRAAMWPHIKSTGQECFLLRQGSLMMAEYRLA